MEGHWSQNFFYFASEMVENPRKKWSCGSSSVVYNRRKLVEYNRHVPRLKFEKYWTLVNRDLTHDNHCR